MQRRPRVRGGAALAARPRARPRVIHGGEGLGAAGGAAPWKGLVAGAVGGLIGTGIMTGAQLALQRLLPGGQAGGGGPNPTEELAESVARALRGGPLGPRARAAGGNVVHFAFGTTLGALYGLAAEVIPAVTRGGGLGFGAAVMVGADELALPALRLAPPPHRAPLSAHATSLGAHLVYGGVSEAARRAVRAALE